MKFKLALYYPLWKWRARRAHKLYKKAKKDSSKYPLQWRFDYAIKKAVKTLKNVNIVLKVEGYKNLPKGVALLACNHQSLADPIVLVAAMKKQTHEKDVDNKMLLLLGKKELEKNKLAKYWGRFLDVFYIDRANPKETIEIFDKLGKVAKAQKKYILVFPEGTRSKTGEVAEFKGGTFRLAKKEFIPIVPVTINNTFNAANLSRRGKLVVTVFFHPVIKPTTFMTQSPTFIAKRTQKIVESKWVEPQKNIKKVGKQAVNV